MVSSFEVRIKRVYELRKWFSHDPSKWEEFRRRYREELERNRETLERLIEIVKEKRRK